MPAASAPGAASTLVSSVSLDPVVTGVAPGHTESPTVPAAPAAPSVPAASLGESQLVAPDPVATSAGVGLVFADGASVQLDPDDPRVRTFRAAAAALMEPPIR
jgi:hypothetical protein